MTRSTLWLFRHAESVANAGGRTDHPASIPLTERGREQAFELAQRLEDAPDRIVASPYLRTSQTAEPMQARFETASTAVWAIQEFTYLAPDSCINTSWRERKPRIDAYWSRMDPFEVDGPGAESFQDLMVRAQAFIQQTKALSAGLSAFVSHGQFMQAVRLALEAPDLPIREAMAEFHTRQALAPFANCERLSLEVSRDSIQAVRCG